MVDLAKLIFLFGADEQFRWRNTGEFVEQGLSILQFGKPEFACGQVCVSKTKFAGVSVNCAEIISAFRFEQVEVANRARGDDLGDVAGNNFSRLRLPCSDGEWHPPAPLASTCA